jgi:hypothetical protein
MALDDLTLSKDDLIRIVYDRGCHVVLLGAGASRAATLRNPERGGRNLPVMADLVDLVGLGDIVDRLPAELQALNFEDLYSRLHSQDPNSAAIQEIEQRVRDYFASMQLPDEPTIYDYLVCSLRGKDLIATFNWDPFLYQAWLRNTRFQRPCLAFLHGNVAVGWSREDKLCGPVGMFVKTNGNELLPTKLLYPVTNKNYNDDEFIIMEWDRVRGWMRDQQTKRFTVFGYGAPRTDVEAMQLLSEAWGPVAQRNMEQLEFINRTPEDELRQQWSRFVHTHHFECHENYFKSSLANYPRRTIESWFHIYAPEVPFVDSNPVPQDFTTLEQLWEWHEPLHAAEAHITKVDPRRG